MFWWYTYGLRIYVLTKRAGRLTADLQNEYDFHSRKLISAPGEVVVIIELINIRIPDDNNVLTPHIK